MRSSLGRRSSTTCASPYPRFDFVEPGADAVAGQGALDEDDVAVGARDAAATVGERVDLELELLASGRARAGGCLLVGHRSYRCSSPMTAALDLDSYRSEAEAFCEALDREYYLHLAGHKRELEVEPIYERHRELFSRRAVEELRELADSSQGEAGRRIAYLLEFAVHGHLGLATSSYEARLAELEVGLDVEVGGEPIPFRVAPVELANEADAARRAAISDARDALVTEHLDPVYLEALERTHELARSLGWSSYRDMCVQLRGVDLDALAAPDASLPRRDRGGVSGRFGFGAGGVRAAGPRSS